MLVFYFLTLVMDLWPAGKSSPRYMRRLAKWQEKHGEGDDFTGRRAFGEFPERWQDRAANMNETMVARNQGLVTGHHLGTAEAPVAPHMVAGGEATPRDSMGSTVPMIPVQQPARTYQA